MDDDFDDGDSSEERSAQVRSALLKALAVLVVIGVVIALGTTIVVRALGLNESDSPGPVGCSALGAGPSRCPPLRCRCPARTRSRPSEEPSDEAARRRQDGRRSSSTSRRSSPARWSG